MEGVVVNATKDQVLDFIESVLWKDIINELSTWKDGFDVELKSMVEEAAINNPSTASVLLHMGDLNGRMKAVEYILQIPELFLSILEDKENELRRDKTD